VKRNNVVVGNPVRSYVLDTFAILCYLRDEDGADKIEHILTEAQNKRYALYLSWINLGEVYYIVIRREGADRAIRVLEAIKHWPVALIIPSENDILAAAEIKAAYPLSYADAFAAALAEKNKAALLTGDREFERLQVDGRVHIEWLPA